MGQSSFQYCGTDVSAVTQSDIELCQHNMRSTASVACDVYGYIQSLHLSWCLYKETLIVWQSLSHHVDHLFVLNMMMIISPVVMLKTTHDS